MELSKPTKLLIICVIINIYKQNVQAKTYAIEQNIEELTQNKDQQPLHIDHFIRNRRGLFSKLGHVGHVAHHGGHHVDHNDNRDHRDQSHHQHHQHHKHHKQHPHHHQQISSTANLDSGISDNNLDSEKSDNELDSKLSDGDLGSRISDVELGELGSRISDVDFNTGINYDFSFTSSQSSSSSNDLLTFTDIPLIGWLFGRETTTIITPPRSYPFYPFNQKSVLEFSKLTSDAITIRLNVLKAALVKLGYKNSLSENDYTAILSSGGFIYKGAKYWFDTSIGRYTGGIKAELSSSEYIDIIRIIRSRTFALGFTLSDNELNNIVINGLFTRGNIKWYYNFSTGTFDNVEIPVDEYYIILSKFKNTFGGLGYGTITDDEYKAAIKAGAFTRYGQKWQFNFISRTFTRVLISEADHKALLITLQERLVALGYQPLSDLEMVATLRTGIIIRGNIRFAYNPSINRYEQRELTDAEFRYFLPQIKLNLSLLGFKDLTEKEYFRIIETGIFISGTIKYVFDFQKTELEKVPLTTAEWNLLLNGIKLQIAGLGITGFSDDQYKEILNTGILIYGADKWKFDSTTGKFIKVVLSENERRRVLTLLSDYFLNFGWPVLTESEIVYALRTGAVFRFGKKWQYDATTSRYELTDITPDEYKSFLIRLREEMGQLGFTDVKDADYDKIIKTGIFFRGGNKYDFNYSSGQLLKVALTEAESKILFNNIRIQLIPLGVTGLTDEEIKQIAATGKFIHGSDKWIYDFENNIFNKVVIPESENRLILIQLSEHLKVLGQPQLSEDEIIEALKANVVIRPGVKWIYNAKSGSYEVTNQTADDFKIYLTFLKNEIIRLGYDALTEDECLQILKTGYLIRGGIKFQFDYIHKVLVKVPFEADDFKLLITETKNQLIKLGFDHFTDEQITNIIKTGEYVKGGIRIVFDIKSNTFIKEKLPESEHRIILIKLSEQLESLRLPQLTEAEITEALKNRIVIQPGVKWVYNSKIRSYEVVLQTTDEINTYKKLIEDEIKRLGYGALTEEEYFNIAKTGYYIRGGIKFRFDYIQNILVKIPFDTDDFKYAVIQTRDKLNKLGFDEFTDEQITNIIKNGEYIIGAFKIVFDIKTNTYNKVELPESERRLILIKLSEKFKELGQPEMTEDEKIEALKTNVVIRPGVKWVYNINTGNYEVVNQTTNDFLIYLKYVEDEIKKLGYNPLTEEECLQIIKNGYLIRGGLKFRFDYIQKVFVKVPFETDDFKIVINQTKDQLNKIGLNELTDDEVANIIKIGEYVNGGFKIIFDSKTNTYIKVELPESERRLILIKLSEKFKELGQPEMREDEIIEALKTNVVIRPGVKWVYNVKTGNFEVVNQTTDDFKIYLKYIIDEINKLGYNPLTEEECLQIIKDGYLIRGGLKFRFDYIQKVFVKVPFETDDFKIVINQTKDQLNKIGLNELTDDEVTNIIKIGEYVKGGFKIIFDIKTNTYIKVELPESERRLILIKLSEKFKEMGQPEMTEDEIIEALKTNVVIRPGVKWVYNVKTGNFEVVNQTTDDFKIYLKYIIDEINKLGYNPLTEEECLQIIKDGYLIRGGLKFRFDYIQKVFVKVPFETDDFKIVINQTKDQLNKIGLNELTDDEVTNIIKIGEYVKGGFKIIFDIKTNTYIKVELPESERRLILIKLSEKFKELGQPEMTEDEIIEALKTNVVIRPGVKWVYNVKTGNFEVVNQTTDDFKIYLKYIIDEINKLGYNPLTEEECLQIIKDGYLIRGGLKFRFDYIQKVFVKVPFETDDFKIVINQTKDQLNKIGLNELTDDEVTNIIKIGEYVKGGFKIIFDIKTNTYIKVELPESERRLILIKLSEKFKELGQPEMTEDEIIEALKTNVVIRPGVKWVYNVKTGNFEVVNQTTDDFKIYLKYVVDEIKNLGYNSFTEEECLQIIKDGYLIRGGIKFRFDYIQKIFVKVPFETDDFKYAINQIRAILIKLGFDKLTDDEIKNVIETGVYVNGGDKWNYDIKTNTFIKVQLPESEHRLILIKLQEEFKIIGQPELSPAEIDFALKNRYIIRAGIKWEYNSTTGIYKTVSISTADYNDFVIKIRNEFSRLGISGTSDGDYKTIITTGQFSRDNTSWRFDFVTGQLVKIGISDADNKIVLASLKEQIKQLGYQFTDDEYKQAIVNRYIIIGGIKWTYNPIIKKFEIVKLSESEYQERLSILNKALARFGQSALTKSQLSEIIYNGYFTKGGYRWEYNATSGYFEIYITYEQYEDRLVKLREQLVKIGYGPITDDDAQAAIVNSSFNFKSATWVYNFESGVYEKRN